MAFNGLCTGNDMRYSSEGQKLSESKLKLKSPKSSYEIISPSSTEKKGNKSISKVDFKPTKQTLFSKDNIPKWIELSFYTIPKKDNKNIISLHIINKSLISKNPYLNEPSLIFYSHENHTDLLRLVPFFVDLSVQMKCDIVAYDYCGFGSSSGKANINNIFSDGEDALNFTISYLKYKIENITLFGKGVGGMISIYLANRKIYRNCKGLILCMPEIGNKVIDVNVMKNIYCQTLLIMEFEDKSDIDDNEVINLCREIPNEREWLPIRKKNNETKKYFSYNNGDLDDYDDVFGRHRSKFITKVKNYIYPDKENIHRKSGKSSTIGGSTDSDSNKNLSIVIDDQRHPMSLTQAMRNKNILNDINYEKFNDKNIENINNNNECINNKGVRNNKYKILEDTEIEINNDEDY